MLKAAAAPAFVVDLQDWAALEVWMRDSFEVESSVKKLILKGVVRLDGEIASYFRASDASTLYNARTSVEDLGQRLLDATAVSIGRWELARKRCSSSAAGTAGHTSRTHASHAAALSRRPQCWGGWLVHKRRLEKCCSPCTEAGQLCCSP